jgi:TetR/AcrR family transcriptional regulator
MSQGRPSASTAAVRCYERMRKKPSNPRILDDGELNSEHRLTFDREEQFKRKLEVILKAATLSLNQLGYSGTSLRKLAASLNITDSALYHYVKTKDELAYLCYMRTLDHSELALSKAHGQGRDGLQKLQIYIRNQIEATCGPDGPTATLSDLPSLRIPHRMRVLKRMDACRDIVIQFFEEGFKDGTVGPCNAFDSSLVIWGAMTFLAKWTDRHGSVEIGELADTYVGVLTSGVAARRQ